MFANLMLVFAGINGMIALGIAASDRSLRSLCQRCWANDVLFALFGDTTGRMVLTLIWAAIAVFAFVVALKIKKRHEERLRESNVSNSH